MAYLIGCSRARDHSQCCLLRNAQSTPLPLNPDGGCGGRGGGRGLLYQCCQMAVISLVGQLKYPLLLFYLFPKAWVKRTGQEKRESLCFPSNYPSFVACGASIGVVSSVLGGDYVLPGLALGAKLPESLSGTFWSCWLALASCF